jgi:hypothetical protein
MPMSLELYWTGLPTRTPAFERQKCAHRHKSSKEHLMVMCCVNASGNHKLKRVVIGKDKKVMIIQGTKANCTFLSIITTRKEHGWKGGLLKTGSTSNLFQKFGLS